MIGFLNPLTGKRGLTPIRQGGITGNIGSFGQTRVGTGGKPKWHKGIDLLSPEGEPVRASADGVVLKAGWEDPLHADVGYGQRVTIDHGDGHETRYAHLSEIFTAPGQTVVKNEVIGLTGRTGNVEPGTPTHLHYEVRAGGTAVDPVEFIA